MLLTQKFHSLSEIDPEFVPALEALMHEHCVNFATWQEIEKASPKDETFCYWLFFGPTQNSPVGIAQAIFKKVDTDRVLPWWKKLSRLVDSSSDHWKSARFQLCDGNEGGALFDPRFARTGRDKLQEVIKELEERVDVMALSLVSAGTPVTHRPSWKEITADHQRQWTALLPLERKSRDYQDYLGALAPAQAQTTKASWKKLHKDSQVSLGDYPTRAARAELLRACPDTDTGLLERFGGGLLTFEKDQKLLGVVHYQEGQQGVLFIEPAPFEPQGAELVADDLYVQYGILKGHELPSVRKIVVCRQGRPLKLEHPGEISFFQELGFATKPVFEGHWSRSEYVE